uniref:CSON003791 protein n=1 Tax=Culicoides sonorensis TaxID=179676 RepID=A0A336N030_CULSO
MTKLLLILTFCTLNVFALALNFDRGFSRDLKFTGFDILKIFHKEPPPPIIAQGTPDNVGEYWIEQKLDNFDAKNNRTWFMRYLANNALYREGGPIFITVGGEWEISPPWIQAGRFYDIAKEVGAFLFYTEHRFYGKSRPTEDTSVQNLKYLTVDQALADLARFIDFIKANIPQLKNSKVIINGGSYAGSMVAWFKHKYPKHCNGAWSSSAPLQAKADFIEYKEVVGQAYKQVGGQQCYDRLNEAFTEMEKLVQLNQVSRIENEFLLCYPFDVSQKLSVWNFFSGLSNIMAAAVQNARAGTIKNVCGIITDSRYPDGIAALAAYVRLIYGSSCFSHIIENDIAFYSQTNWNHPANGAYRQWIYQTCNEFGWYQTSGSKKQPFGSSFPLELYVELCKNVYGEEFNLKSLQESTKQINGVYKATNIPAKNVYYTNGELDPWRPMGVQKDRSKSSPADVIPEAAHVMDFYSISLADSPEMMMSDHSFWNVKAADVSGRSFTPLNLLKNIHREPPPPARSPFSTRAVETKWFTALLDNFNSSSTATWNMRFMANNQYFVPGGPLFIYIGAEWEITQGWLTGGHTHDMARYHRGYLVYTEHRYYGESRPTPDVTFENLKYLNVDQALADLARFIVWFKSVTPGLENSKVIVVGGSYAGTMAVWMRQKYPDLVQGSWASSAPLLAKTDFVEYKEVMGYAYRTIGGQYCYDRLEQAFSEMERLVDTGDVSRIERDFNLCSKVDLNNQLDVWNLFSSFGNSLAGIVQYHWPGSIESVCDVMVDSRYPDGMAAFAAWIRSQWGSYCFGYRYEDTLYYYKDTQWGAPSAVWRQWYYQTCVDFGYYQTSGSPNQPFGKSFPVELYIQMCTDAYDSSLTREVIERKIAETNAKYGALSPGVTNVYFTQGDIDPWSSIGIKETQNEAAPAFVVPLHSHCADLYSASDRDTQEMKYLKDTIWNLVDKWLKESPLNQQDVKTDWFTAELDNFNSNDNRTWQMRFLSNDEFFVSGGPLFIYIGAEWEIAPEWIVGGHMYDIARNHSGFLVYTEHRYYGQSRPTADMSFKNLTYLNVDQALADLAKFITWFKEVTPGLYESKVIVTGASYAGSMAVWMRQKYPEIVTGSWASSAPLLAKVDFYEYKEMMGLAFQTIGSQNCYDRFWRAFTEMERLVFIGNFSRIDKEFNLCSPLNLDNQLDIWTFFEGITSGIGVTVQYHSPGVIEKFCELMIDEKYPDSISALAVFVKALFGPECLDPRYETSISFYKNFTWGNPSEMHRQWTYQTCIDFGYYQTSTSPFHPFGTQFPLEYFLHMCQDAFDESLTKKIIFSNIEKTNDKYFGLQPRVTNVFFTHGEVDPWSAIGMREIQNQSAPVMIIPEYGHCFDIYSLSEDDPPKMKEAKMKIWTLVEQWLKDV